MLEKLKEIISQELGVNASEINEDTVFADYDFDSLDAVNIMMRVEEELGVFITDDKAQEMKSVKDLIRIINEAQK